MSKVNDILEQATALSKSKGSVLESWMKEYAGLDAAEFVELAFAVENQIGLDISLAGKQYAAHMFVLGLWLGRQNADVDKLKGEVV